MGTFEDMANDLLYERPLGIVAYSSREIHLGDHEKALQLQARAFGRLVDYMVRNMMIGVGDAMTLFDE